MKKYMAIYVGTEAAMANWRSMDPQARAAREQAGIQA